MLGEHSGTNLGCILWGMQMSRNHECKTIKGMFNYIFYWCGILIGCQLTATLDNTSNNVTTCKTMEDLHYQERLQPWNGSENQLLSRSHIFTNPAGQYIEVFNKLQIECGVTEPLKILLHSNVQWGTTTFFMLNKQVTQTSQTMSLYLLHSFFLTDPLPAHWPLCLLYWPDVWPYLYNCHNGHMIKHIPWATFTITKRDWERVKKVCSILALNTHLLYIHKWLASINKTLTVSNNTFLQRSDPLSGRLF